MTEIGSVTFSMYLSHSETEPLEIGEARLPIKASGVDEHGHVNITPDIPQMLRNIAHEMVDRAEELEAGA